jgi:hypothetical protein
MPMTTQSTIIIVIIIIIIKTATLSATGNILVVKI